MDAIKQFKSKSLILIGDAIYGDEPLENYWKSELMWSITWLVGTGYKHPWAPGVEDLMDVCLETLNKINSLDDSQVLEVATVAAALTATSRESGWAIWELWDNGLRRDRISSEDIIERFGRQ